MSNLDYSLLCGVTVVIFIAFLCKIQVFDKGILKIVWFTILCWCWRRSNSQEWESASKINIFSCKYTWYITVYYSGPNRYQKIYDGHVENKFYKSEYPVIGKDLSFNFNFFYYHLPIEFKKYSNKKFFREAFILNSNRDYFSFNLF